ncbi:hypothetical protein XSR1_150073 [Xenorhabdus szentirmaii DSM 16338]|uniref:Uncharacterized protein n=1 Tax=Xenorhabdus szentirmaii DSM 16338 TaxID=1427518 RepID=W1ITF4_9GAMM|nr:hypothetical protein XSR1_150073 [Xenorhabdus szentirmaii DSM 16338]
MLPYILWMLGNHFFQKNQNALAIYQEIEGYPFYSLLIIYAILFWLFMNNKDNYMSFLSLNYFNNLSFHLINKTSLYTKDANIKTEG